MPAEFWYTVLGGFLSGLVGAGLFFFQRFKAKRDEQQKILFRILELFTAPMPLPNLRDKTDLLDKVQVIYEQHHEIKNLALRLSDLELSCQIYSCDFKVQEQKSACIKKLQARVNKRLHAKIAKEKAKQP